MPQSGFARTKARTTSAHSKTGPGYTAIRMKNLALFALLAALACGCNKPAEEPAPVDEPTAQAAPAGGSGGITPMTPTPLPFAPVAGTENLQGGGSAAGQILKEKAKGVGGSSSLDQMPDDY